MAQFHDALEIMNEWFTIDTALWVKVSVCTAVPEFAPINLFSVPELFKVPPRSYPT